MQHPTPAIVVLLTRNPTFTFFDVSIQIFECMGYNQENNNNIFYVHLLILTLCQCRVISDPVFSLYHYPSVFAGNWNVFPTRIHPGFPVTPDLINSRVLMGFLGQGHRVTQRGLEWGQLDTHSHSYTEKSVL